MSAHIQCYFSSEDGQAYRLTNQQDLSFSIDSTTLATTTIHIKPEIRYQSILGMGASLEEASIYNLSRMSPAESEKILHSFFNQKTGIGWNLMRICFGSSDFTAQDYYSYDDMPPGRTDLNLDNFSIQKDIDYDIIATIQKVLRINPKVKIFASPWSPPGWMKSRGSLCGGSLLHEYTPIAARYYRKAIEAYRQLGIEIYAITLQNEPLMVSKHYPTCKFTWQEQLEFLKIIKEEFTRHGITTKIWIFDHNFNKAMKYPAKILADPEGYAACDGVAFHAYEGNAHQMAKLHEAFPGKDLFFTEYSTWGAEGIDEILIYFRNWARSYNAWVFCLDDQGQPNAGPHPADPTFITVSHRNPEVYEYIPEYYLLGQITKFVQPGAHRVDSNYGSRRTVTNTAFLNPDGTLSLVVVNQTESPQIFQVTCVDKTFTATLPQKTVATYQWTWKDDA